MGLLVFILWTDTLLLTLRKSGGFMKASKGLNTLKWSSLCSWTVRSTKTVLSAQASVSEWNTTPLIVITELFLWRSAQSLRNVSHTAESFWRSRLSSTVWSLLHTETLQQLRIIHIHSVWSTETHTGEPLLLSINPHTHAGLNASGATALKCEDGRINLDYTDSTALEWARSAP